jgi:DNA mismatch repair protein MutS
VRRAREVLANLEGGEFEERGKPRLAREAAAAAGPDQLPLLAPPPDELRRALRALDPDGMTPIEALLELARLRELAGDGE